MKKMKWKSLLAFLSLLIVTAVASVLVFNHNHANAATSNLTITFGSGKNWTTYVKETGTNGKDSDGNSLTDHDGDGKLEANESVGPRATLNKISTDKVVFDIDGADPGIFIYLPSGYKLTTDDIVCVKYAVTGATYTGSSYSAACYYFDTSGKANSGGFNTYYHNSSNAKYIYAEVPSTKANVELSKIRLDLPENGAPCTMQLYLYEVYIGSRSGSPSASKFTITFKNPDGSTISTKAYGYKETVTIPSSPTYGTVPTISNEDTLPEKYVFISKWTKDGSAAGNNEITSVGAQVTPQSKATSSATYYAIYRKYHRVRFYNKNKVKLHTSPIYVSHNGYIKSVITTLPTVPVVPVDANERFVHKGTWTRDYLVSSTANTTGLSVESILGTHPTSNMNVMVGEPLDIIAEYDTYYAVRFYKTADGPFAYADYITTTTKDGWYKKGSVVNSKGLPTPETVSGKTFVSWVSTGNDTAGKGNPVADNIGAINETTYRVNSPLWLHPRYLSNSFVGSTTNGIVVNRTITQLNASTNKYQVRVELYTYGKKITNTIDIFESFMGNFKCDKSPQIFFQAYLGNGKFDESTLNYDQDPGYTGPVFRTSNAGAFGYVYDKLDAKEIGRPVAYSNNSKLTAYTWVRARFFDPNFKTYDEKGNKSQCTTADYTTRWQDAMVCREYDSGLTTMQAIDMQKGFRIVMLYEISPKVDRSIGGNNFLLSHENYMKVVVGSTTYNFHSDAYKTTCVDSDSKKTKRTALDPNINIKIQYDFVVHDYYMDLLDYDNTQTGFESNARVFGYLSTLQNSNALNNEKVYGRMYSHGNVNVYNDKKFNPNNLTMPNTDVDGTRNARVNIFYTVTHQNGTVVYETQILGNKDITKADVVAHIKNAHDDVKVDFTKDHYVTVKARVEAITHDTDSFGTAADTNVWEKSANAYFFAPRFIVADYGRVVAVDLQNESLNKSTFTETPSYVLRTTHGIGSTGVKIKLLVNGTEVSGTKGTETKTNNGGELYQQADAKTFALYSFNTSTYSNPSTDNSNRKFLEGAQVFSYTTDVINHLKYSEALTVQRNVYVIPANNVLYDHYFLDFTKGVNSNTTNSAKKWTNPKPVGSIIYNCTDDYGYSTYGDFDQHTDYGGNNSVAVASPDSNTRNVYGNFTFKGTGFEIISRTGNTGVLIVEVYKKGETTVTKRFLVDTYLNSTDTLYQVPIVQCTDLEYGEYNVEFRAYYHEIFDHAKSYKSIGFTVTEQEIRDALGLSADEPLEYTLSKSGYHGGMSTRAVGSYNVYVDGVRIYNPLGTSLSKASTANGGIYSATAQNLAYALYGLHGELGAQFVNVNDLLLDMTNSEDWFHDVTGDGDTNDAPTSESGGDVNGILYIATNNSSVGSADAQVGGLYLGSNGQISVVTSGGKEYLVDASGNRLKSNCHQSYIYRTSVYNENHQKYFWVYTCECSKPHKMTRTQIQKTGITFYNSTYETIGPENEVYLMSYNSVALCLGKNIKSVQVGLRAANNNRIGVRAYYNNKYKTIVWDNGSSVAYHTNSGIYNCKTEMYLDVTNFLHKDADGTMYLLLGSSNTGQYGIVALDTLKVITTDGSKFEPKVNARTMQLAYEMMPIEDELPVDESVQMAHALTLESDITVKYIAKAEQLAQYDSFYMEVTTPVYEGNELVEERTVVLEPVAAGEYYYFYLEGVSAKQMNDTLTAKIYMVKDGETYVSRTNEYSVATYAYNMLAKEEASDALKTVCANLLRYGAEAQKYFGYRTDSLADEELGQNQREYLIDTNSLELANNMAMHNDLENATASFKSATLVLSNKVIVSYTLNLANYEGNIDDLAVRVSYVNAKGETVRAELTEFVLLDETKGLYSVECDILSAKQMRTVLTAAIYEGETQISRSVDYSIETYAAKAQGELVPLCNAMIAYGDAANAFFAN